MATISGPFEIDQWEEREYGYRFVGLDSKLHYRTDTYQTWKSIESDTVVGYVQATPSGYRQAGYRNTRTFGKAGNQLWEHTDRFVLVGTTWTEYDA